MGASLVDFEPERGQQVRLVCFPYAGGSASSYRDWAEELAPEIAMAAVELAGRGRRLGDQPVEHPDTLVAELTEELLATRAPVLVLFGHCMGAVLAYESAVALADRVTVAAVITSARGPERTGGADAVRSTLAHDELVDLLRRYDGTPKEILDDPEMLELALPAIRADLALVERLQTSTIELPCRIEAMYGDDDPHVDAVAMAAWADRTSASFALHRFPGAHFFPFTTARERVLGVIRSVISESVGGG